MSKSPAYPPMIAVGAPLEKFLPESDAQKLIEGVHYPKGIQGVDLSMMFGQITFRTIAACKSDEELRALRTKVMGLLALFDMQELAKRV